MGARHPNGTLYMIVDPSTDCLAKPLAFDSSRIKSNSNIATYTISMRSEIRKTTSTTNEEGTESEKIETIHGPSFNYDLICPAAGGVGIEGKGGNKVLNKVKMGVKKHIAAAKAIKGDGDNDSSDINTKTNSSTSFANTWF